MSKKIVNKLLENGMIVVFDVDGVLAPYEWGENSHSLSTVDWNLGFLNGEDLYANIKPIKKLQKFINKKDKNEVYVYSCGEWFEIFPKTDFCANNYSIQKENIAIVKNVNDKLTYLDKLCELTKYPQEKIAIVEDTVSTLDYIARNSDYMTVHVSSFFDLKGE